MRCVFDTILRPRLPDLPDRESRDRSAQRNHQSELSVGVQAAAKAAWPHLTASGRVARLATELNWKLSRAKDLYYGHEKMALRGVEQQQVDAWLSSARRLHSRTVWLKRSSETPG